MFNSYNLTRTRDGLFPIAIPSSFYGRWSQGKWRVKFPRDTLDFTLTESLHTLTCVNAKKTSCVDIIWTPVFGNVWMIGAFGGWGIYVKTTITYGAWASNFMEDPFGKYEEPVLFLLVKRCLNGNFLCCGVMSDPIAVPLLYANHYQKLI